MFLVVSIVFHVVIVKPRGAMYVNIFFLGRNSDSLSCQPTPQPSLPTLPNDRTKPVKKPQMIPLNTFDIISDYMLQLPAPQRNVFLSVKEYPMDGINPFFVKTKDSPTHVLVFCMR